MILSIAIPSLTDELCVRLHIYGATIEKLRTIAVERKKWEIQDTLHGSSINRKHDAALSQKIVQLLLLMDKIRHVQQLKRHRRVYLVFCGYDRKKTRCLACYFSAVLRTVHRTRKRKSHLRRICCISSSRNRWKALEESYKKMLECPKNSRRNPR